MDMAENTVWAMMAGGLLSLALLAAADALVTRSIGAVRNLMLIVSISAAAVLLSGLPQAFWPDLSPSLMLVLQTVPAPLSSALGLRFLDIWLGGRQEDPLVSRITRWGAHGMLAAAALLLALAATAEPDQAPTVLALGAIVSELTVVLAMVAAVRAALLGDPLARWLVVACAILACMLTGLYLHALGKAGFGLAWQAVTAMCTLVFVLIVMVLIVVRNRESRRLARLARLESGSDPATGLATGSRLLSEVEHAFWRTGRLRGKCVVVCIYMTNLYELGEALGRSGENQILSATAARIRRAVGFRCVVGLYHPRCFVIVISTERRRPTDDMVVHRLQALVNQPLSVVGSSDRRQTFLPQTGIAMLAVLPDHAQPQSVLNEAEHLALHQARAQAGGTADEIDTVF
jgi:GGDEF domain-containing protein